MRSGTFQVRAAPELRDRPGHRAAGPRTRPPGRHGPRPAHDVPELDARPSRARPDADPPCHATARSARAVRRTGGAAGRL